MACLLSSIIISYYSVSEWISGRFICGTETGSDKMYLWNWYLQLMFPEVFSLRFLAKNFGWLEVHDCIMATYS